MGYKAKISVSIMLNIFSNKFGWSVIFFVNVYGMTRKIE